MPEGVSGELIELLHYIEHTSETEAAGSSSPRIKELHRRVSQVKVSEEIGVRYMQEWEERMYQLQDAKAEGREEGREEGRKEGRAEGREEGRAEGIAMVAKMMYAKGIDVDVIASMTGMAIDKIKALCQQ